FAKGEIGLFLLFFIASLALLIALESGAFSRNRMKWAAVLIALLIVIDMARANAPWVRYHDYKQKYAGNPVITKLAAQPYEHRVAAQIGPLSQSYLAGGQAAQMFGGLMSEWLQHLFQYNNLQSVDIIQFPL